MVRFPVDAVPRPIVLLDDRVLSEGGFADGDSKLAWLDGAIEAAALVPAEVMALLPKRRRAFERWSRIGAMDQPNAYVRRMIVNDYVSWHRRRIRTTPRPELESDHTPVDDGTAAHAERDAMIRRLAELPRRQRAAVVLRYYAGLPDAQIADQLGCRESTVRSQVSRALATLRLDLAPTGDAHVVAVR